MKNTIIKKAMSLLMAASCVAGMAMAVSADENVEITEATFPDEAFRTYVKEKIDTNGDSFLSEDEIKAATEIDVTKKGIADLKGIEYFTEVNRLTVDKNKLTEMDLSKNTKISSLYCNGNKLKTLDLSENTSIHYLSASNNKLTELNISKLEILEYLEIEHNSLTSLDITGNPKLGYILGNDNDFTVLDISKCPGLVVTYTDGERDEYGGEDDKFYSYQYEDHRLNLDIDVDLITGIEEYDGIVFDFDAAEANENIARTRCSSSSKTTVIGAGDQEVTFTSEDESVAKIDENGNIVGVKAGLVKITAKCGDKEVSRNVRVLYKDLTDDKTFWFTPTYYLTDLGVVKGYENQTKFKAANKCTRAQMVTFIWRLVGSPEPKNSTCKFNDVKESDYFYKACIWGNENRIVEGYNDDTFRPQVVCARRHAVTFLWRLANCPEPTTEKNKFIDVKESDYFYKPTLWASELKILEGYNDDTFRPNGACLRRQMTTFLYKYDKFVNGKG